MKQIERFTDFDTSEEEHAFIAASFARFSFAAGATKPDDSGTPYYTGRYLDRPFKVEVVGTGQPALTVKVKNPHGEAWISWDPDKQPKQVDPDWDDGKLELFFGPGVYVEGDKDEIERIKAMTPPLLSGLLGSVLPQLGASKFYLKDDQLELGFDGDIVTRELAGWMQMSLDFCAQVFRELKI
jgi:hypothetical protein